MKLKAVFNKKFGQWKLCHDQWCKYGETSVVAHILTSEDEERDGNMAKQIAKKFNAYDDLKQLLTEAQEIVKVKAAQDAHEHFANLQPGHPTSVELADKIATLLKELTA